MTNMILVTGATGTIGRHVVRLLAAQNEPVRAMMRDISRAPRLPGVESVTADFDDPASLARAADGVDSVFLLTVPASPTPTQDLAMLDAARKAGVTRLVRLSAIGTGERDDTGATVGVWHGQADDAVRDSGMPWTVLRPSVFASNVLWWTDAISNGQPVPNVTGTATQGIVDPRDVAAVAVAALTSPGHNERTYTLTGPELLSVADQAAVLERVLGRSIPTVDLSLESAKEQMLSHGQSPAVVDASLIGMGWARAGHNAILTDDVARVLGRPPGSFESWAQDHRDLLS
ncbi:NAD(P)H-binding protein [Phytoactinopolyspora limicola]|uniref:NAD(P)H-binding protein n=1 Tax=Phytoactinopolyspora limicola TaxID=2715536 RepID=UPI001A9C2CB7|nr:NAD(P)H-binding protein [Phytoactinopolyspora limicola]